MLRVISAFLVFVSGNLVANAGLLVVDPFTTSQVTPGDLVYPDDLGIGPQPTNNTLARILQWSASGISAAINPESSPGTFVGSWGNGITGDVDLTYADTSGSTPFDLTFNGAQSALLFNFTSVTGDLSLGVTLNEPDGDSQARNFGSITAGTLVVPFSEFGSSIDPSSLSSFELTISRNGSSGTASFNLDPLSTSAVPEPTSLATLGLTAIFGMGYTAVRRRKRERKRTGRDSE